MAEDLGVLAEALVQINVDLARLQSQMQESRNLVGRSMRGFQEDMRVVGRRISFAITAPIAGGFAAAVREAIKFEDAFVGVKKTVEATPEQFEALKNALQELSITEIPQSANDLAKLAESAGQLGIQTKNIVKFTRVIAMLGDTTNIAGQEGAQQLARFLNITGTAQEDIEKIGSVIVDLGNNMATTEAEILTFSLRLGGAGTAINLTEEQILGFSAALSSMGLRAEKAGTAFSKLFIRIANAVDSGGEKLEGFAEVAGMTGEEFYKAFKETPSDAIISFIQGLAKIRASGQNVFAVLESLNLQEIRLRDTLLLAAAGLDKFVIGQRLAAAEILKGTALGIEAEKRYMSTTSQLKFLANAFRLVGETVGSVFSEKIRDASGGLRGFGAAAIAMARAFRDGDKDIQLAITGFAGILAVVGPLIFALATLAGVVILVNLGFGAAFSGAIFTGAAALVAIGSVVLASTVAWKNFEPEIRAVGEAIEWMANKARNSFGAVNNFFNDMEESVRTDTVKILRIIRDSLNQGSTEQGFFDDLVENQLAAIKVLQGGGSTVNSFVKSLKGAADTSNLFKDAWTEIKEVFEFVKLIGKNILPEDFSQGAIDHFDEMMEDVVSKIDTMVTGLLDGDAALVGMGDDAEELKKKMEDLKDKAEQLRLSLFPQEDMARAVREVEELARNFPEIIDDEAVKLAFREIWENFAEEGEFAFSKIDQLLADLPDKFRQTFAEIGIVVLEEMMMEEMLEEMDELFKESLEGARKWSSDLQKLVRQVNQALDALVWGMQRLAKQTGSSIIEGISRIVTAVGILRKMFIDIPKLIKTFQDAAVRGMATFRIKLETALGVIGLILEGITLMADAFGLFGDEGEEEISRVEEAMESLNSAFARAFEAMEDQLISFVREGKIQFNDLIDTFLDDLLRLSFRALITGPIADSLGIRLKSGGVITKGQVLTAPTLVAAGVTAGESGPEAVLPLTTKNGQLGVMAAGGGGGGASVVINDYRSFGNPVEVQQEGDNIAVILTDAMSGAINGGRLDRSLRESFGLRRKGGGR